MKLITLTLLLIATLTSCSPNEHAAYIQIERQVPLGSYIELAVVDGGFESWLVIDPSPEGKVAIVTNIDNSAFFRVQRLCQPRTSDPEYIDRDELDQWFVKTTEK